MTSEVEALKTNEFLRRRKLRIQQVREQSKDIAKKIRQRAEIEKFRHAVGQEAKKGKDYREHQNKFVQELEQFRAESLQNVGSSHKKAEEVNIEEVPQKTDLSRQRGKEAALELKRKKQEQLDEQRKKLDRRLQAREAANEISREKSSSVAQKLSKSSLSKENAVVTESTSSAPKPNTEEEDDVKEDPVVVTSDMATQWNFEAVPQEWVPHIPVLSLPKDSGDSAKEITAKEVEEITEKRRPNLFAVSDEMPSSLRGGLANDETTCCSYKPNKPSLTLVSEYLQNRELRLREPDIVTSKKPDDLHSIKKTLQKTRAGVTEGSYCHVADVQLVPVPSWHAEINCGFCSHNVSCHKQASRASSQSKSPQPKVFKDRVMKEIFNSKRYQPDLSPTPVLRGSSPFRRCKVGSKSFSAKSSIQEQPVKLGQPIDVSNKSSVTMYNHATRDSRDIPFGDRKIVFRDSQAEEDAYSQAMKESSLDARRGRELQKKIRNSRNKIAMTKQTVEKEFKDTMAFLNSLPKDTSKPIKTAYKNESQQKLQNERRQKTLQEEFKKIEKECRRQPGKNSKSGSPSKEKAKSPPSEREDNFKAKDFQYSWMPVPESDGSFAIHTIPTTLKENKSSNTVKFSQVDSYHEYRSRHKHTPPTKDTTNYNKPLRTEENDEEMFLNSSPESSSEETSSEDLYLDKIKPKTKKERNERLSDAERIIIYKILDSKTNKKSRCNKTKHSKCRKNIAGALSSKDASAANVENKASRPLEINSLDQLNEGVYKTINEKGDNIASLYFPGNAQDGIKIASNDKTVQGCGQSTCHLRKLHNSTHIDKGLGINKECGDEQPLTRDAAEQKCECAKRPKENKGVETNPSTCTSTSSFKTATNDKATTLLDNGFVKLLDDEGQDAGKFYIGATGFLKNDDFEVIIQLRKKDGGKQEQKNTTSSGCATDDRPFEKADDNELLEHEIQSISEPPLLSSKSASEAEKSLEKTSNNLSVPQKTCSYQSSGVGTSSHEIADVIGQTTTSNTEQITPVAPEQSNSEKFVEASANTALQDCALIMNKTEPTHKPMSTCTQTSFESPPPQRPVFIHMSSTTSTAYMSPPEMIIPSFLKPDRKINPNDFAYPGPLYEDEDDAIRVSRDERCTCRNKCSHPRKTAAKMKRTLRQSVSPQNSYNSEDVREMFGLQRRQVQSSQCRKTKKCSKCGKSDHIPRVISQVNTCRTQYTSRRSRNAESVAPLTKTNAKTSVLRNDRKKRSKHDLNPLVKWYVNKLLSLNRDGLKAINVANQECSAVTTPGSSIVDTPSNFDGSDALINNNISLEQLKEAITKQVLERYKKAQKEKAEIKDCNTSKKIHSKKKIVHKVKSLNISKHLLKTKSIGSRKPTVNVILVKPDSTKEPLKNSSVKSSIRSRSKSSPSPRAPDAAISRKNKSSELLNSVESNKHIEGPYKLAKIENDDVESLLIKYRNEIDKKSTKKTPSSNLTPAVSTTSRSKSRNKISDVPEDTGKSAAKIPSDSGNTQPQVTTRLPLNTSTQTIENVDDEINFIKMAEDKLQNMEKIADLTEICTKRLSNLAKVLDEVRKNKSLAYNQASSSESDTRSEKSQDGETRSYEPVIEVKLGKKTQSPPIEKTAEERNSSTESGSMHFIPFLKDIPRPDVSKTSQPSSVSQRLNELKLTEPQTSNIDVQTLQTNKSRGKPPPALARKNLKHGHDVVPHELSTVLEIESPMSAKVKNQSLRNDSNNMDSSNKSQSNLVGTTGTIGAPEELVTMDNNEKPSKVNLPGNETKTNPDLLQSSTNKLKNASREPNDPSTPMMDMKQFNEIMLKPFISIQEYAKQCNASIIDEGSNLEDVHREEAINDDLSSLHSDGSLPDVIAELLKRNIISEPFKFDTVSNANSTSVSSESTLSMLALSKVRKDKKKSSVAFQNKENIVETSDTLSISSNPDLENAFKKLGIGWASSTLKKTKERLALSSSSNTSSSSLSQFKLKGNQDVPVIVNATDSVALIQSIQRKPLQGKVITDSGKNAEQQTSMTNNSMTVKQFLTNELANKITFMNKTDDTGDFVSLYETKLPEEMKHLSKLVRATAEQSMDSVPSGSNNRARTSTPVQIYKSMTYHSSSSSNISNGLFSNADLSSVKGTSNSQKNHSTTDKDDLTIPNYSLRMKKGHSDNSE